ncbi:hypothetical protein PTTG_03291 [Puccinia triticina 1-1 BBBD Race 1]|uniref:DDE Tnp4 domain-containing protein n=1 Tax=Puccinia triticina (isolate 1-1 / race 1 (BBBD)) TaxID=630390 RepID=A0A180GBT5_PUCT1|nr:hypothetical protein PTTG_03291 [Puccinia triticina 1-1 BBBD Race 1]
MLRHTKRASTIHRLNRLIQRQVRGAIVESALNDNSGSSENGDLEEAIVTLILIKKHRYLAPRTRLPHAPDNTKYLFSLDELRFKQEFRMLQHYFFHLLSKIEDHPVFQNNSNIPQRHLREQLMVTLKRMGLYGNSALGAVILYCSRTIEAILSLEKNYVQWPDVQARQALASQISSFTGFRNCVGIIDGTLFPLYNKPSIDPQDYYLRKGYYGLAALVVCNEEKQITYHMTGFPVCLTASLPAQAVAMILASGRTPSSSLTKVNSSPLGSILFPIRDFWTSQMLCQLSDGHPMEPCLDCERDSTGISAQFASVTNTALGSLKDDSKAYADFGKNSAQLEQWRVSHIGYLHV